MVGLDRPDRRQDHRIDPVAPPGLLIQRQVVGRDVGQRRGRRLKPAGLRGSQPEHGAQHADHEHQSDRAERREQRRDRGSVAVPGERSGGGDRGGRRHRHSAPHARHAPARRGRARARAAPSSGARHPRPAPPSPPRSGPAPLACSSTNARAPASLARGNARPLASQPPLQRRARRGDRDRPAATVGVGQVPGQEATRRPLRRSDLRGRRDGRGRRIALLARPLHRCGRGRGRRRGGRPRARGRRPGPRRLLWLGPVE